MVKSFGQVIVAAGGTPARATVNQGTPSTPVSLQSVRIQVRPANTGLLYVFQGGSNFSGDHRTSRDVCLAILPAPASTTSGPFEKYEAQFVVPVGLNLADIWLDVSVNGDGAIVSGTVG